MLANKLALVTGSASGIGLAVAKSFIANGASVALVDFSKNVENVSKQLETNAKTNNVKISAHICDVSKSDQVNQLFNDIIKAHAAFKSPNVIVNSAGIVRDAYLAKMTEDQFDQVIATNLKGTYLITQAAARHLIKEFSSYDASKPFQSYGSIINLASVIGKYGAIGQCNYGATKAGVEGFTRSCAKELGRYKIRCNAILPGFIDTPMTQNTKVQAKVKNMMMALISLGRIGLPEDIAELALFLASDKSSYITGCSIECSGGLAF